ncbi:HIT family protein [Candidatus Uhrbacteria bacterium]|nr:HIT family protein [Candidatus Uhrbacteria bacterium]
MNDCLFCKIIAKEIPSTAVYEDVDVYAFLDVGPVNPGHVLVVPKAHSSGLLDTDPQMLKTWTIVVQNIARAVKLGLGVSGFNLQQNEGVVAGQTIMHLHAHIIPRYEHDGLKLWSSKRYASPEEAQTIAEKIKNKLIT